jgi:hypothetical protein
MKANHSFIAAAVLAVFTAGASATYFSTPTSAVAPVSKLQPAEGVPHNLIAMKADEGVPQNLITALRADEGVPHNLVTAMVFDEGVPWNLVTAMNADEGVPQNLVTV